jgi:hypothetical protein
MTKIGSTDCAAPRECGPLIVQTKDKKKTPVLMISFGIVAFAYSRDQKEGNP